MNKKELCPVALIAAAAGTGFYGLYVLAQAGYRISSWVFVTAAGLIIFTAAIRAVQRIGRYFPKRTRRTAPRRQGQHRLNGLILCISAGFTVGAYGELSLRKEQLPPRMLAPYSSIRSIAAELCGEPVPRGKDYYRVPVRLLACIAADNGLYSASGTVQVLLPAGIVRASYAGGITRLGGLVPVSLPAAWLTENRTADPRSQAIMQIDTVQLLSSGGTKPEICRFYARGGRLLISGRFERTGRVFYARTEAPLFLGWNQPLNRIRAFFRFYFIRLLYGWGDAGGLLLALLAADKAFLPQQCIEAFRDAGLAHILALSGMHLSLIAAASLQSGRIVGRKKYAVRFSLAAVCLFVWFAGSAPSLNRALGMFIIAALGGMLGIRAPVGSILCAMLIVHIGLRSTEAVTLGFMLSYGSCAGIIVLGAACTRLAAGFIPPDIAESIAASIGAQLFTAPIVISSIGTVATAGIFASCAVGPIVSFFLIAGLICIPFALLFPPLGFFFGYGLHIMYLIIFKTAVFFSRFPLIKPENTVQRLLFSAAAVFTAIAITAADLYSKKRKERILQPESENTDDSPTTGE